jgi:formylmethanofuran dehydrogenase subunit E
MAYSHIYLMEKLKLDILLLLVIMVLLATIMFPVSESNYEKHSLKQTVYGSGFDLDSCEEITEEDIYQLCLRIFDRDPEEFEAVLLTNKFHQHIGPNNIYGAKMALYAKDILGGKNHEISVLSESGTAPPLSCLNDGIMVAIGATFGRGLIKNSNDTGRLAATFRYGNNSVRLEVKPEMLNITQSYISDSRKEHGGLTDSYFLDVRKMGLYVWENMSQEDMFIVTYPEENDNCEYNDANLNSYFNSLHDMVHASPDIVSIMEFIDEHPCVQDGSVDDFGNSLTILSVWKSNNETIEFVH